MRSIARCVLLMIIITCVACCLRNGGQVPRSGGEGPYSKHLAVTGNEAYDLSESDVLALQQSALTGGSEAAFSLSLFYGLCRLDLENQFYWVEIAAENGGHGGQYSLGFLLLTLDKGARSELRARFWLERAAASGNANASSLLKHLPDSTPAASGKANTGIGRKGNPRATAEANLDKLEVEALRGEPDKALSLYLAYETEQKDPSEIRYWTRISAQNGDPMGEYGFGVMLSKDADLRNRLRSRFWLKKAANNGIEMAESFLESMPAE